MFRTPNRVLAASVALGLTAFTMAIVPAAAAVDCPVPAAPVVQQFTMTPPLLTAPAGDAVEHTTLAAQVDACGAGDLTVHVDVTAPDSQTTALEGVGPGVDPDGTFSTDLPWGAGDVGHWTFTLVAETVDLGGVVQQTSATLPFEVVAPAPPPPPPVLTTPGAPRSLRVAARTATAARLSWLAPATDGGSSITAYRIIKPGADVTVSGAARSATVRGLRPATAYAFSVQALNAKGHGPASKVAVRTLATVPGKPGAVKVSTRTTTSGRVAWHAPSSNGGATITGYRIVKPGRDVTVAARARSYTVRGLQPGRSYAVKVQARNAVGYGPGSSVVLRTLATVPGKPGSLTVSKRTRTSGRVAWHAPSSNGGAAVNGYRIVKPGRDVTVKASARSYTVKGLKPGHTYTIKVRARNARGYGASAAVTLKTKRSGGGGSCTPGYLPCLPPASDYDCAGGSGDGPKYVEGPVYVTGSDPYDLDRDGDGVACES